RDADVPLEADDARPRELRQRRVDEAVGPGLDQLRLVEQDEDERALDAAHRERAVVLVQHEDVPAQRAHGRLRPTGRLGWWRRMEKAGWGRRLPRAFDPGPVAGAAS